MNFQVHSAESAPAGARSAIAKIVESWGFLPNLARVMAGSPAALELLLSGYGALSAKSTLSPAEQQLISIVASRENDCAYCVAAHSTLALGTGLSPSVLAAARQGSPIEDPRLNALQTTTAQLVRKRGWLDADTKNAFSDAGYQPEQLFEVVGWVALKLLTNYTNHLAETPVDSQWSGQAWNPRGR
jgi:AhpD family alkylhydroperoxidase